MGPTWQRASPSTGKSISNATTSRSDGAILIASSFSVIGLLTPRQLPPLVQGREAAHRRRHQKRITFVEDALHVGGVHVRVAHRDLVLSPGLDDMAHGVEHLRVLV